MGVRVDLTRLRELRKLEGMTPSQWQAMVLELGEAVASAVQRIAHGAEREDFRAVARAAHDARNDALMLGCDQLTDALGRLERGGRHEDAAEVERGLDDLDAIWPAARSSLEAELGRKSP